MAHEGYTSYDQLAKTDPKIIKEKFAHYNKYLHERFERAEIRSNYFRPAINALELFLTQNDVEINFKKFKKQIPEQEQISGDEPYTTEEIQDMLKDADIRSRALVLFLSSSGVRGGSIWDYGKYLKFKHLKRFDDGCSRILIYPGTKSQYPAFLTPEATQALTKYRDIRIANGEIIEADSPLFRNIFKKKQANRNVKPLTKASIDAILRRLAENIGVRKRSDSPYKRHEKRTEYGFRIRWNTIMKNHEPPLNDNKIERMFSHSSKRLPLDKHYNKPEDMILHEEFDKAKAALTIDSTERMKVQLEDSKIKRDEFQELKKSVAELKEEAKTGKVIDAYIKQLLREGKIDRTDIDPFTMKFSKRLHKLLDENPTITDLINKQLGYD
jgi:hypothetical protein